MEPISIRGTGDGSPTLYSEQFKATYHSLHGAFTESEVVFIKSGLEFQEGKLPSIRVFEVGFGSGINTYLSQRWALSNHHLVEYTTIEAFPIEESTWLELSINEQVSDNADFTKWHSLAWDQKHTISEHFTFLKILGKIEDLPNIPDCDVVFFDAFAPSTQPELWEKPILQKMYNGLSSGGVLTTYCAKGSFKRTLKEIGFKVESLQGPPGKREIVRAVK